jgi:hypothetical protein
VDGGSDPGGIFQGQWLGNLEYGGSMIDLKPIRFGTLALFILAGCNSDPAGVNQFDLAMARDKWNRSGIQDYQVEFRQQGFLASSRAWFTRLDVHQGQVISAQPLDSVPNQPPLPIDALPTVPDVFNWVESELQSTSTRVTATFDATLGYPRKVEITCLNNLPDCGVSYELQNLRPLATP